MGDVQLSHCVCLCGVRARPVWWGDISLGCGSEASNIANGTAAVVGPGFGDERGVFSMVPCVFALAVLVGDVYAGGAFLHRGGTLARNIANGTGQLVGRRFSRGGGALGINVLPAVSGSNLYVGESLRRLAELRLITSPMGRQRMSALGSGVNAMSLYWRLRAPIWYVAVPSRRRGTKLSTHMAIPFSGRNRARRWTLTRTSNNTVLFCGRPPFTNFHAPAKPGSAHD